MKPVDMEIAKTISKIGAIRIEKMLAFFKATKATKSTD
jgi:hypothetical protein